MTARMSRIAMASVLAISCIVIGNPSTAKGVIGPYTLPFFWPIYSMNQAYGCTGVAAEGTKPGTNCVYPTQYWHTGIDWGLWKGSWVASSNSGTSGAFRESVPDHGNAQDGGGNYVYVQHASDRFSLYYHLDYLGVVPAAQGTPISAGQLIAYSGDTGPGGYHLHYELDTQGSIGCVPISSWCDIDPNQWTTSPGRVPWRADFVSEASPSGYNVMQYSVWTTWVRFKNVGGRAWSRTDDANGRNKIYLAATTPPASPNKYPFSTRVSSFYVSSDWQADWLPGVPDGTVSIGVDATATFTFQLRAGSAGTYNERFDILANSNFWFDYWESGYFSGWYIPITVQHCC